MQSTQKAFLERQHHETMDETRENISFDINRDLDRMTKAVGTPVRSPFLTKPHHSSNPIPTAIPFIDNS